MPFIYSTLSNTQEYRTYKKGGADLQDRDQFVIIKGGSGVANKNLVTPQGVATDVSEAQLKMLEENPMFQLHVKNGFIKVEKTKAAAEKVAANMEKKDKSAPKTSEDFKEKAPKAGK